MIIQENTFFVKSSSSNFQSRQRSIFNQLAREELNVNLYREELEPMQIDDRSLRRNRRETRALRGQESLFKAPNSPPPRRSSIPDFRRNPHRWTRYTLADVPATDMTDASNTAAALSFLRTLRRPSQVTSENPLRFSSRANRRRMLNETNESLSSSTSHPPSIIGFGDTCEPVACDPVPERSVFKDNKLVMPEYVVGEKKKIYKNVKKDKPQAGKELKLSHLLDDEDDDEDN